MLILIIISKCIALIIMFLIIKTWFFDSKKKHDNFEIPGVEELTLEKEYLITKIKENHNIALYIVDSNEVEIHYQLLIAQTLRRISIEDEIAELIATEQRNHFNK